MMNEFIKNIQTNNWGWPWHIILAAYGQLIFMGTIAILLPNAHPLWAGCLALFIINGIGYGYEVWQKKKGNVTKSDQVQDLIANTIGSISAGAILYTFLLFYNY